MQKYEILKTRFHMRVGSVPDPSERRFPCARPQREVGGAAIKKYFSDISFLLSVKYVYLQP